MADQPPLFTAEWKRLASSQDERLRKVAKRLLSEPIALRFFPYSSHAGLHVSRNSTPPRDAARLPWILTDTGDGSYVAIDERLEARGGGHLEEAVQTFIELLRQAA